MSGLGGQGSAGRGGPLLTWSGRRLGSSSTAALGLLIAAAGLACIGLGVGHGYWPLAGGLLAIGAGVRLGITVAAIAVLDGLPAEAAGTGAALGDTFQEVGGAIGVALLGSIYNATYRADLPAASPEPALDSLSGALGLHDAALTTVARDAFASGAQVALLVAAGILAAVAAVARLTVRRGLDLTKAS